MSESIHVHYVRVHSEKALLLYKFTYILHRYRFTVLNCIYEYSNKYT